MPRTSQTVQVGRRKIELSNLEKVFYPDGPILKAELIAYYLQVAPTVLAHLKGRPLSLVRYPDGIDGERFFQKNRPEWAPEWIAHVVLGGSEKEDPVDYVMATEEASLVWLANLACIELHQMPCRSPHFDKPDYFVFDLDPPENYPFEDLIQIALDLKEHTENFGYRPFVKTTGSKGFHILVPIEPKWTFDQTFAASQEVARLFVESHRRSTTLQIKKEARQGRVLVDIYRNRAYQTIVSAYSLRGLPGAPVSMPLPWDQLASLNSAADFTLSGVPGQIGRNGDAWEGIAAYAASLHTVRKRATTEKEPETSLKHQTPKPLTEYAGKRSFEKTPEPLPATAIGAGNAFVVHRHHATRLHYDLRLEQEGCTEVLGGTEGASSPSGHPAAGRLDGRPSSGIPELRGDDTQGTIRRRPGLDLHPGEIRNHPREKEGVLLSASRQRDHRRVPDASHPGEGMAPRAPGPAAG